MITNNKFTRMDELTQTLLPFVRFSCVEIYS